MKPSLTTAALAAFAATLTGCTTIKHSAVDRLGDALAAGGTTFAADDDPQLVAIAAPFSLKLMESLLAERPRHRGLLLAAASGWATPVEAAAVTAGFAFFIEVVVHRDLHLWRDCPRVMAEAGLLIGGILLILGVLLITYLPALTTWLPRLLSPSAS
jgi:hypothetical protein